MATVNYSQSVINTRLTDVVNAIDGGGGNGQCKLFSAASVLISTLVMPRPSGTAAGGVLTFVTPWVDTSAANTGAPVSAQIQDSTGTNVITGLTVGAGSTSFDIVLSNAIITAGQTVAITTASIIGR
jgi:hypothetical protein